MRSSEEREQQQQQQQQQPHTTPTTTPISATKKKDRKPIINWLSCKTDARRQGTGGRCKICKEMFIEVKRVF
ncbi:hypothetical protein J056_004457 [Wallemia ichthyophaga EXF-994]|uniref:Uncharacterized protein n=1 Tax=Wallemia ichthyophaga (strain EXF-994 / CBS 113033) TaxID=1299270 RepID=R9AM13_WALI9|nr:uncharacterized protein J056_004457 [Wallemia ichthyophaga EXF-994]EOR01136.1 hypothetical protein J056_004457 [Wallemia ichthyophaga EXF-994]